MRTMYDSVNAESLPSGTTIAAGYVDGLYANVGQMIARFPKALVVDIVVNPQHSDRGRVLDIETGDANPNEAPGWVLKRRQAGIDPSVYCNSSTWPLVRQAFADAGVPEPHYWIAHYDGDPTIPAGAVAKQYASNNAYDTSSVADYWPGIDPPETDMTPDQARLLQDLHDHLVPYMGWQYRNQNENQTSIQHTGHPSPDAWGKLSETLGNSQQLLAALKGINDTLTQLNQNLSKLTVAEQAPGA